MVDALHVYSPHILKTLEDTIERYQGHQSYTALQRRNFDITRGCLRFATAMPATIISASFAYLVAINGPSISG